MKGLVASLALGTMLLASTQLSAQTQFGIKTGANFLVGSMKLQPDPKEPPTNPKGLGLHFGAYAKVPFSDMVGLRPELLFSFRRAKSEQTSNETYSNLDLGNGQTFTGTTSTKVESDQRLQYFEVALPLTVNPSTNFRVMLGPAFGILMGGKVNTDNTFTQRGTFNPGNQNGDVDQFNTEEKKGSSATKDFTKFEMAAIVGAGYELDMGLDFDLRFYRAIVPTYDQSQGTSRNRFWTNLIEFSLGYTFGN